MTITVLQAIAAKKREIELTKRRIQDLTVLLRTQKNRKLAITKTKETGRTHRVSKKTGRVTSMSEDDERILEYTMKQHQKAVDSALGRRLPVIPSRK